MSEPPQRAAWPALVCYALSQGMADLIPNVRSWSNRTCEQILGLTRQELDGATALWSYENDDLRIHLFPFDNLKFFGQQTEAGRVQSPAKTAAARANGERGGRPRKTQEKPTENPPETHGKPTENPRRRGRC